MMKKLGVTVFAISLTAFGCGSDDGGKKDAARPDGPPGAEVQVQPDSPIQTDLPVGPEVQADQPITPDSRPSAEVQPVVDVQPGETGMDAGESIDMQPEVDGGTSDAPMGMDGGTPDIQPTEAGPAIDAGVDAGSVG